MFKNFEIIETIVVCYFFKLLQFVPEPVKIVLSIIPRLLEISKVFNLAFLFKVVKIDDIIMKKLYPLKYSEYVEKYAKDHGKKPVSTEKDGYYEVVIE